MKGAWSAQSGSAPGSGAQWDYAANARTAAPSRALRCGSFKLGLSRPLIMGVVNVTPDSFSDGGHFADPAAATAHALRLIGEGADLLDIGGESTRPGAMPVAVDDEMRRVLPVIEALAGCGIPLSVDTSKPAVMRAAIAAGACMINDVCALEAENAMDAVAGSGCAICLMHKQKNPGTMQLAPHYLDVVAEVRHYLASRAAAAREAGIPADCIVIDPGFGFGKTAEHNLQLLRELRRFTGIGIALMVGLSRKSTIGQITGRGVMERVHGSVAAALLAVQRGADIVRVHDVAATRDALAVLQACGRET
jgi:dihydropteroate synthase